MSDSPPGGRMFPRNRGGRGATRTMGEWAPNTRTMGEWAPNTRTMGEWGGASRPTAQPAAQPSWNPYTRSRQVRPSMAGGITGGMAGIRDTGRQSRDPIGSVNYGAVAGIQNYLQNLAPDQQGQASAYLRSQGLMPTYNGTPLDQVQGPQRQWTSSGPALVNRDPSHTDAAGNRGAGVGAGTPAPAGWQGAPPGRERGPSGAYSPAAGYLPGMGGSPNLMDPSGGGGLPGGGTMGFPLEGSMQGAIQGVLDNPSPYSAEQTARLQSRATSGNNAALQIAQQRAREDAARRGLSPTEVSGSLSEVCSRFSRGGFEER